MTERMFDALRDVFELASLAAFIAMIGLAAGALGA
jgi:hypothetical protein